MTVPDLLNVLGLHAPIQAGAIKGRVQRRLDALPRNRTYDRGVLKAIERKLLEYMRENNLVTILLNEESEDYTAVQDTGGQVSQDPTRFYGARSYPQTIVAGDVNPIDRRVIKKTLVVDSSYRKQYVAGDGIRACAPLGCVSTPEEAVEQVRRVAALRDKLPADRAPVIEAGISTAFGCTMEGQVDEGWVVRLAAMLVTAGADSVSLADTVGHANPAQIKRVFTAVRGEIGDKLAAAHLHNTLGLGLANALAAYEVGVRSFDSSLGGLGGCPFAPGASGNVVTEDLVFMFEAMGVDTGIDIDAMLACREIVKAWLPSDPLFGHLADVGLPKGFLQQAQAAE